MAKIRLWGASAAPPIRRPHIFLSSGDGCCGTNAQNNRASFAVECLLGPFGASLLYVWAYVHPGGYLYINLTLPKSMHG
jgi:hypothetical protein